MLPILLATILMGQTSVQPGLSCTKRGEGIRAFIAERLRKDGRSMRYRTNLSTRLSGRIMAEAKRHKLDPLVLTTIAWVETGFNHKVRGKYGGPGHWQNEAGIWQLIPGDAPVRSANKAIIGCKPGPKVRAWRARSWKRRFSGKPCLYPDVAERRARIGYFSRAELKDLYISTWIAAYEIRQHINSSLKRHKKYRWPRSWWFRKWSKQNPEVNRVALARYSHFNTGSRWLRNNRYLRAMFRRYSKVRDNACKPRAIAAR